MAETRSGHPFAMYDGIRRQPACVARLLEARAAEIARAGDAAAASRRIFFAGIGSSYHAAQLGELFLRHLSGGRVAAGLEQSFELVHYQLRLTAEDCVVLVSHRGVRNYSVEALHAANAAGALTIAVTGETRGEGMRGAQFILETCEIETAFAHTKSFTTALAALALLAIRIAQQRGELADPSGARSALESIPQHMEEALACESACREAASRIAERQRWIFTGAGPNWVTAREGALKVKETSYIASEGFETEQFLHGPVSEADHRAAVCTHLAGGAADARASAVLRALGEVGALRVAIASRGAGAGADFPSEYRIELPAVDEWLSPFVHTVAVQWLAYYAALARGTNPDTGRQDHPAHMRAFDLFKM